jgi:hypothetical protein
MLTNDPSFTSSPPHKQTRLKSTSPAKVKFSLLMHERMAWLRRIGEVLVFRSLYGRSLLTGNFLLDSSLVILAVVQRRQIIGLLAQFAVRLQIRHA